MGKRKAAELCQYLLGAVPRVEKSTNGVSDSSTMVPISSVMVTPADKRIFLPQFPTLSSNFQI